MSQRAIGLWHKHAIAEMWETKRNGNSLDAITEWAGSSFSKLLWFFIIYLIYNLFSNLIFRCCNDLWFVFEQFCLPCNTYFLSLIDFRSTLRGLKSNDNIHTSWSLFIALRFASTQRNVLKLLRKLPKQDGAIRKSDLKKSTSYYFFCILVFTSGHLWA